MKTRTQKKNSRKAPYQKKEESEKEKSKEEVSEESQSEPKTKSAPILISSLQSVIILYLLLAFFFIAILGWCAASEPAVMSYLAQGKPALTFLTPAEASHMNDVRLLIAEGMHLAAWCALILAVTANIWPLTKRTFRISFFLAILLIIALIPFPWTFTWLHSIFFPQGNWQFPADSWLITHFSETFFGIIAFSWIGLTTVTLYLLQKATHRATSS